MKDPRPHRLLASLLLLLAVPTNASNDKGTSKGVCSITYEDTVKDACASYAELERINRNLRPTIRATTQELDYFGYYRLNLYGKECPFWTDDTGMCGNIACAVNTIDDEEHIPPIWRAEELGKLEGPKATHPKTVKSNEPSPLGGQLGEDTGESCIVETDECDERDYCVPEDEKTGRGDYVSLKDNPERYTGYAGMGANNVWSAIYRENCFPRTGAEAVEVSKPPFNPLGFAPKQQVLAAADLKNVIQEIPKQQLVPNPSGSGVQLHDLSNEESCLEKRVFYRVISGMHASISMHLCWDHLNQSTGEWGPNLACYLERFSDFPDRLQNIYFNYALVLRAVSKLQTYLNTYTFCSSDPSANRLTKSRTLALARAASVHPPVFNESLMFADAASAGLKEDFRNRFRNVSRIMDCVGCDKCRLWGKVQTQGYGTALKVLFEFDEKAGLDANPPLRRTELVALVNTLDRISTSIHAAEEFRKMAEEKERVESGKGTTGKKVKKEQEKVEKKQQGLWEDILDEVDLVWQAYKMVMISWYRLPGQLWFIAKTETIRLWQSFIGVYVTPRQFAFEPLKWNPVPRRGKAAVKDEL